MRDETVTEIRTALTEKAPPNMSFIMGLSMLHLEVLKGTKMEVIDRNYQAAWGSCKMILQDMRTGQKYEYSLKTLDKEGKPYG